MPVARRMTIPETQIDALKAELRREILTEVQDSLHSGNDLTTIRDALDERLEQTEPPELDIAAIRNMSPEQINSNWAEVQRVMSAQKTRPVEQAAPQIGPLNWDKVRAMTPEEHTARRAEVEAFLQREGRKA